MGACDEEVTPPPRPKVSDDDLRSGTPPSKIVTPFAKLQLAAWKRAEAAMKGESQLQNIDRSLRSLDLSTAGLMSTSCVVGTKMARRFLHSQWNKPQKRYIDR